MAALLYQSADEGVKFYVTVPVQRSGSARGGRLVAGIKKPAAVKRHWFGVRAWAFDALPARAGIQLDKKIRSLRDAPRARDSPGNANWML
jgi:hypothetical protein